MAKNTVTNKELIVQREPYGERDGLIYYSYFIKGQIRGKDVRVALIPPDKGGYSVLDIVFMDIMSAPLQLKPYEMKSETTGEIIKGNTYFVQTADENGEIYECNLKPFRSSDKSLLKMLLR